MKLLALLLALLVLGFIPASAQPPQAGTERNFADVNRYVQERSIKIYGAGGFAQLEAYQSGFVVSLEGHIATVSSLVLDRDEATVLLGDGRKYTAQLVGTDPVTDVALLKIDIEGEEFPYFDLEGKLEQGSGQVFEGQRVFAFSNLYNVATGDEPVSVLQGIIAAIAPLEARRGAFSTRFRGDVYVLDAPTNNPGAAGGVLVDLGGVPLGMLGKEVRSEVTGTWLNYALPLARVAESVQRIRAGQTAGATAMEELPDHPATFAALGFRLVPNVVARTPPYVDEVRNNSPAAREGMRPDDLVVAVGGTVVASCQEVVRALERTPGDKPVMISLLRGDRLLEIEVTPAAVNEGTGP